MKPSELSENLHNIDSYADHDISEKKKEIILDLFALRQGGKDYYLS